MKQPTFYISTPLYYTNAAPHLGHLYSTLYADFIARYKKEQGYQVFFVTGADQHGEKIFNQAQLQNESPEIFIEKQTKHFLMLWKKANIQFTHFSATHNLDHQQFLQQAFLQLQKQKFIYLDEYQGQYCVNCESFQVITSQQKNSDEKCQICQRSLKLLSEENYFLKISQIDQKEIQKLMGQWKEAIPEVNFMNQLNDLFRMKNWDFSITRKKLSWGIVVDKKREQKAYVWFDALLGYISVLNSEEQKQIWENKTTEIVQVIGKEIMKFHLIYWPLFLKFLDYRLPNTFLIHGWILQKKAKMSKSQGNVVNPFHLIELYDAEVLRLYLASLMNPHLDIDYDETDFQNFYESFIVNNLSNFHYRILSMCAKYQSRFEEIDLTKQKTPTLVEEEQFLQKQITDYHYAWKKFQIAEVVQIIFRLVDYGNQIIHKKAPWKLHSNNQNSELSEVLYRLIRLLKLTADFLKPLTPDLSEKIYTTLGNSEEFKKMYKITLNIFKNFKLNQFQHLYERKKLSRP